MDARLRRAIDLFNHGRFFEAHELLEECYHEAADEERAFLEALIGLAAAFRLFADFGEVRGPVRMIYQALIRLENYQPAFMKVRVSELCENAEAWAKTAEAAGAVPAGSDVPKIKFQSFSFFS